MPYWTPQQEKQLRELLQQGQSVEELSQVFNRSQEAIRLKLRRLNVTIPETRKRS